MGPANALRALGTAALVAWLFCWAQPVGAQPESGTARNTRGDDLVRDIALGRFLLVAKPSFAPRVAPGAVVETSKYEAPLTMVLLNQTLWTQCRDLVRREPFVEYTTISWTEFRRGFWTVDESVPDTSRVYVRNRRRGAFAVAEAVLKTSAVDVGMLRDPLKTLLTPALQTQQALRRFVSRFGCDSKEVEVLDENVARLQLGMDPVQSAAPPEEKHPGFIPACVEHVATLFPVADIRKGCACLLRALAGAVGETEMWRLEDTMTPVRLLTAMHGKAGLHRTAGVCVS